MGKFAQAALIIIDVQKAIDAGYHAAHGPRNNVDAEGKIACLLAKWRADHRAIVHVRHDSTFRESADRPGQDGNNFKAEVMPLPNEAIIPKTTNSAFIGTPLEAQLRAARINKLIVTGVSTNNSVEATVRMAGNLGFTTFVVSDATAAFRRPALDGSLRPAEAVHSGALSDLHGEFATVVDTAELLQRA